MTEIHATAAPRISESTLRRLRAFARPSRLTADSTMFDAGYERCKQDLMDIITAEAGPVHVPVHDALPAAERRAQKTEERPRRWWQ